MTRVFDCRVDDNPAQPELRPAGGFLKTFLKKAGRLPGGRMP
jgi:hypothetical protein